MQYHITRTHWDGEKWVTVAIPFTYTGDSELAYDLCELLRRMAVVNGESLVDVLYMVHGE